MPVFQTCCGHLAAKKEPKAGNSCLANDDNKEGDETGDEAPRHGPARTSRAASLDNIGSVQVDDSAYISGRALRGTSLDDISFDGTSLDDISFDGGGGGGGGEMVVV